MIAASSVMYPALPSQTATHQATTAYKARHVHRTVRAKHAARMVAAGHAASATRVKHVTPDSVPPRPTRVEASLTRAAVMVRSSRGAKMAPLRPWIAVPHHVAGIAAPTTTTAIRPMTDLQSSLKRVAVMRASQTVRAKSVVPMAVAGHAECVRTEPAAKPGPV